MTSSKSDYSEIFLEWRTEETYEDFNGEELIDYYESSETLKRDLDEVCGRIHPVYSIQGDASKALSRNFYGDDCFYVSKRGRSGNVLKRLCRARWIYMEGRTRGGGETRWQKSSVAYRRE